MDFVPGLKKGALTRAGANESLQKLSRPLTPVQGRLLDASADITLNPATRDNACWLHTVLTQTGMPRKRTDSRTFERRNGTVSLFLTAGTVFNGRERIWQPLPYGPKPRLVLINLSTVAVQKKSPVVDVGRSTREFMERVGMDPQGSEYRSLRTQIAALSACRMELGWVDSRGVVQNVPSVSPVRRFEVWLSKDSDQQTVWPQTVELTREYFDGLMEHAVPLDERAVAALRGSALALDIYTWLAHRLCRVRLPNGEPVRWEALMSQFGQEYGRLRNFRAEFRAALVHVLGVYPDARVGEEPEGIRLWPSLPPIPKSQVFLS